MRKKPPPEHQPEDNPEDQKRTEQTRRAAEEYANDQREIIKKLRKNLN
jgi:hypothetical protein